MILRGITWAAVLGWSSLALAQQQGVAVQLPTFSSFSVSTSIVVPDAGRGYLGGVSRAGQFSSRGPFGSRSFSSGAQAGGVSVHATIHDFQAMDRALLSDQAPSRRFTRQLQQLTPVRRGGVGAVPVNRPPARRELPELTPREEALKYFRLGLDAQDRGKKTVARIHFERAYRRADDDLRPQVAERLLEVGGSLPR